MTTRVEYPIDAIQAELGYIHEVTLVQGLSRLAETWRQQRSNLIRSR